MTGFAKISPASPTRSSGRGPNAKKDPPGNYSSLSRVSLLKRQSSAGTRFQTTSITKHFELNHQVYEAFQAQYYNLSSVIDTANKTKKNAKANLNSISDCFALGYNYAETALLDLPTHGYFYSNGDQVVVLRKRSSEVALQVTKLLQRILKLMDAMNLSSPTDPTNLLKDREDCKQKVATLRYLANEQCEHLDAYEDKRKTVVAKWKRYPETKVVGNHRGFSNEATHQETAILDCETIGESFLSCSRILCPGSFVPELQVPVTSEPSDDSRQPPSISHKSLVDKEFDQDDDDDDEDETNSNGAVFQNSGNLQAWIQSNPTDDAVFEPNVKTNLSGMMVHTGDRRVPSPDPTTGDGSTRQRKVPNSKKKQQKQDAKKSNRYTTRLFGKKKNSEKQQQNLEEAQMEEALYQSELEAAKAASMRDELSNGSYDDRDGSSIVNIPAEIGVDYDLQEALYQSELEAARIESFEAYEEEKRDDTGHEELRDFAAPKVPVVVRGVPVAPAGAIQRCRNAPYNSLRVLKGCCRKDFERLREQKQVQVTRIPTYQGRIQGSTNGCTVIAPLLCAHYFKTKHTDKTAPARLSDCRIGNIIDVECPSLLPDIRNSLGVSKNAFLIPHDAHEYLIDHNHMSRNQFVTVCGGNILGECHLDAFIRELSEVLPGGKRLGATFFFHQHVIAILQLRNPGSKREKPSISFDVIDSLPNRRTLPVSPTLPIAEDFGQNDLRLPPDCARIFCKDVIALKATLKWYACSVFTPENERYIDDYHWDEKLTDFDPRVFQAFVWKQI